jgi:hypothetical protein
MRPILLFPCFTRTNQAAFFAQSCMTGGIEIMGNQPVSAVSWMPNMEDNQ